PHDLRRNGLAEHGRRHAHVDVGAPSGVKLRGLAHRHSAACASHRDPMPTLLYETLYGSRAFGLAREGSDEDVRGIIVGPRSWYFGMFAAPEQVELGKDHMRYELRKFLRLIEAANPVAIEMLFTDA